MNREQLLRLVDFTEGVAITYWPPGLLADDPAVAKKLLDDSKAALTQEKYTQLLTEFGYDNPAEVLVATMGQKPSPGVAFLKNIRYSQIHSVSTVCPMCGKCEVIHVEVGAWNKWEAGGLVQRAFPDLSDSDREMLVTGTCPKCWNKMFEGSEE